MLRVRDRDAPVSREGIIFRVMGYEHPNNFCICDVEYAPEGIYKSSNPRAVRDGGKVKYYKFYFDEGLRFIAKNYPRYRLFSEKFGSYLVGIYEHQIYVLRRPDEGLRRLYSSTDSDPLLEALYDLLDYIMEHSRLKLRDFGVFGSILHKIYNVFYSDIDLIVYGIDETACLRETLNDLFESQGSMLVNEYSGSKPPDHRYEKFKYLSKEEYLWHQKRKNIYVVLMSKQRRIKAEFEPVLKWSEINNNYEKIARVRKLGFVEAVFEIVDDTYSPFMPSIYDINILNMRGYALNAKVDRFVSFVEEYRLQLFEGERGIVRGWLEEVTYVSGEKRYQITLSIGPRYYDQVLKKL